VIILKDILQKVTLDALPLTFKWKGLSIVYLLFGLHLASVCNEPKVENI